MSFLGSTIYQNYCERYIQFFLPGDFVMVEPIAEGDKVKAEIVNILYKEQLKYIKDEGLW